MIAPELTTILNEAIPKWVKLTGTKLGTNQYSFRVGSDSEFQEYDLKKYVDALNQSRSLDMSGTTSILLLRGLFEAYVKERSFSAHTLLYEAEGAEKLLARLRTFHELIDQQPCRDAVEEFRVALREAAVHYGYDVGKLKEKLANERALGNLRLSASSSLDELAVHQFSQGARDPAPLQYNRQIFEFSSINSFIHALRRQAISGITLALIRHADVYQSFFVLGLRNGDTVTVLTDFQEGEHPEYHNVTRRPDRRLDERARQHWFPYRLLESDPVKHRQIRDKTALVRIDAKPTPIDEISNLEPAEFIWLILLFGLIRDRFDRDDFKTAELSYTGEMVVNPHALVDGQSALVLSGQYQPLVLPKLTVATATPELAGNVNSVGHNAWLEERYRDRVPEILLDVVGERKALEVGKAAAKLLPGDKAIKNIPSERQQPGVLRWGGSDKRVAPLAPSALNPTYFGTRRSIEKTLAWYGRNNLIQGVQRFATAEFAAKQEMMISWYRKRIERNMAFLWKAVAVGELVAPAASWKSNDPNTPFPRGDKLRWTSENILSQKQARKYNPFRTPRGIAFGGWDNDRGHNVCAIDPPTHATVFTLISPDNPRALALLMGIPEKRIPWPLQHWTTHEPYFGNPILARIDPQDSQLDNPWRHLDLTVSVSLSKSAYNRLRKEHGLPAKVVADAA